MAPVLQGLDGGVYGTTFQGGAKGYGTVFKLAPNGALRALHSFVETDGANPWAGLIQTKNSDLYGTTSAGGVANSGTIFKITTGGVFTLLYSFCATAGCLDGAQPRAGLIQATDGSFYGTTSMGGAYSSGTVFKITGKGKLTTLYSFCAEAGCPDGALPIAELAEGIDGNFYGTTWEGGDASCGAPNGCGTVFKITRGGDLTTLHTFAGMDGGNPGGALVEVADGAFYGTTADFGPSLNGTVFKISPGGHLITLHAFNNADGSNPIGALVQATDGNFYGTSLFGGQYNNGAVFEMAPDGSLLRTFSFVADPWGIIQAVDGSFYVTNAEGGNYRKPCNRGCGTILRIDVGLAPFVKLLPDVGKIGATVRILGPHLESEPTVSFNGVPAAAVAASSGYYVTTTVPVGATTGFVTETVSGEGTLTSNKQFRVIP